MTQYISTATLRSNLADAVKSVASRNPFLVVTKKHRPVSALVNIDFFEDLLARASPEYLKSIRQAREDYRKGRVHSHHEIFGRL